MDLSKLIMISIMQGEISKIYRKAERKLKEEGVTAEISVKILDIDISKAFKKCEDKVDQESHLDLDIFRTLKFYNSDDDEEK